MYREKELYFHSLYKQLTDSTKMLSEMSQQLDNEKAQVRVDIVNVVTVSLFSGATIKTCMREC
jgi:hypothetical protein